MTSILFLVLSCDLSTSAVKNEDLYSKKLQRFMDAS